MKTCRKLMAWLIALSTIMLFAVSVSAENELKSWDFKSDWLNVGKPADEDGTWNDSYGNENVWGVRAYTGDYLGEVSEIAPKNITNPENAYPSIKAWYWGDYRGGETNYVELLGSDGMVRISRKGEMYMRIMNGYNHALKWTAPESMVATVTLEAKRTNNNNGYTSFDLYQNGLKVRQLVYVNLSSKGPKTGTVKVILKKGDTLTLAISGKQTDGQLKSESEINTYKIEETTDSVTGLGAWDYRKDAFTSADNSGIYGDSYGNDNTWGIYFGKNVDGTYVVKSGVYKTTTDGNYLLVDGDDSTAAINNGTRTYFKDTDPYDLTGTAYAQVSAGTDLYYVFRAPKDMNAKFNIKAHQSFNRASANCITYLNLYSGENNVINSSKLAHTAGSTATMHEYVSLKRGETVTLKVSNNGTHTTTVNTYIDVEELGSCDDEYNPVVDYKGSRNPLTNNWKSWDGAANWSFDYTKQDGTTVTPTASASGKFAVTDTRHTFLPGETWGAASFADDTWYYMNLDKNNPWTSNLKWTAPKDGMIAVTYKGSTRYNNGWQERTENGTIHHPMHVEFGINKNADRILNFESAGLTDQNVGSRTIKIAVEKDDVINFTTAPVEMANGEYADEDIFVYSNVEYVGEASGKLTFNAPTVVEGDETVTATISGTNETGSKAQAVIVLAEYNAQNRLTNVDLKNLSDYSAEFSQSVSLSKTSGATYRAFVWDSMSGMKPIK